MYDGGRCLIVELDTHVLARIEATGPARDAVNHLVSMESRGTLKSFYVVCTARVAVI